MKTCTIPTKKTVAAFKDYDFENCNVPEQYQGDYPHHNFCKKVFMPILRREFKKLAEKTNSELVNYSGGYFIASAYFKRGDKYVYVSISDVRWNDWYGQVLYRTAADAKDSRGGANHYCAYDKLEDALNWLLK